MIDLNNISSLSDFQRNTREYVARLRETGRPEVLTVHGRAELVVQHAEAYQKLLDLAAHASAIVGIQRGLRGMYQGTGEDAEDAFASLERELGDLGAGIVLRVRVEAEAKDNISEHFRNRGHEILARSIRTACTRASARPFATWPRPPESADWPTRTDSSPKRSVSASFTPARSCS